MFDRLLQNPSVLVQGITGKHGSFHTKNMLQAGTPIVAGVTPGKTGQLQHGIPVYNSVNEALQNHTINISVVFVPPTAAKSALLESIRAGIPFIVCITEGIPVHDMIDVIAAAKQHNTTLIGPNCPGILMPGLIALGIIPSSVGTAGNVAVVSRSGTLTYEAAASLSAAGIGQRYIVGIGGDKLRGTSFIDCLQAFQDDPEVSIIVLIGEIGGQDEQLAADYIAEHIKKPVFAYVVGHSAPAEKQLGHAGAIMGGHDESAAAKAIALAQAGAHTASSLHDLILLIQHSHKV